jgi:ribosomal protein S18 acetylase RimI-like enzyme
MDGGLERALAAAHATLRHDQRPGDIGELIRMHGLLYCAEHGYDVGFEGYVAKTFAACSWPLQGREKLWIVERDTGIQGSIAVITASEREAQIRWLLLHPELRGCGVGKGLVTDALSFCRASGYSSVLLWTEGSLNAATALYRSAGFRRTEERTSLLWGAMRTEERYDLSLR